MDAHTAHSTQHIARSTQHSTQHTARITTQCAHPMCVCVCVCVIPAGDEEDGMSENQHKYAEVCAAHSTHTPPHVHAPHRDQCIVTRVSHCVGTHDIRAHVNMHIPGSLSCSLPSITHLVHHSSSIRSTRASRHLSIQHHRSDQCHPNTTCACWLATTCG